MLVIIKASAKEVRDKGCEYISKADWKNLTNLELGIID